MSQASEPTDVRATLNYLFRTDRKPYSYTYEPPPGVPARYGEVNAVSGIIIRDARSSADQFSLDEQGFEIHSQDTAVTDFYEENQIREIYYPEVEALLATATGAEKIVIFDHTIRSVPKFEQKVKGMREPVRRVHNDYTATSGVRRVRDHLNPEEAEQRLKHRFLEVNVWRPIRGPLQDAPLAVCDARTIVEQDLIASDLIYPDKTGETYSFSYNPAHAWYYFPKMKADEALLIKCFDSDANAKGRYTAHTAFDDPTTPADALPRESIEIRALVFFPPDGA
ncbi:MAG TPA: CmcJ/NvfI family oxidoreductase [Rhizomicrobium sp.]|nr:CmcJ/NvfI family oxidoreductase [Rhizomicrobium sp.]